MLAEYGFIGVGMLLFLIYKNIRENNDIIKAQDLHDKKINKIALLAKYLNMSTIAYAVGGVFLGGINYPHLFILTALTLRIKNISNAKNNELYL
jgi:hypothetical protein